MNILRIPELLNIYNMSLNSSEHVFDIEGIMPQNTYDSLSSQGVKVTVSVVTAATTVISSAEPTGNIVQNLMIS